MAKSLTLSQQQLQSAAMATTKSLASDSSIVQGWQNNKSTSNDCKLHPSAILGTLEASGRSGPSLVSNRHIGHTQHTTRRVESPRAASSCELRGHCPPQQRFEVEQLEQGSPHCCFGGPGPDEPLQPPPQQHHSAPHAQGAMTARPRPRAPHSETRSTRPTRTAGASPPTRDGAPPRSIRTHPPLRPRTARPTRSRARAPTRAPPRAPPVPPPRIGTGVFHRASSSRSTTARSS